MPDFLEQRLRQEAAAKGFTGRHADRYVYGAMNNRGYMRGNQETQAGVRLDQKHARDVAAGTAQGMRRPKLAGGMAAAHNSHPHASRLGNFLHPKGGYR